MQDFMQDFMQDRIDRWPCAAVHTHPTSVACQINHLDAVPSEAKVDNL